MELKEFRKLVEQQHNKKLREPDVLMFLSNEEIKSRFSLLSNIIKFIEKQYIYDEQYIVHSIKKGLQNCYGLKETNNTFSIHSSNYNGKFKDLHFMFKDYEYPDYILNQFCHKNCFEFALHSENNCSILSGISYRKESFIHSVILLNDYILDFNYDLMMTKELYFKLFNFEVLNVVRSEDLKENIDLIANSNQTLTGNTYTYGDINFCFNEVIENLKLEQNISV